MVSGRTASALRARRVLAQGRRADLERRFADRGRIKKLRPRCKRGEGTSLAHRRDGRRRSGAFDSGLRRRILLHLERAPLPGQRHAGKDESQGQAGARPHCEDFSAGLELGRRLLAADQACGCDALVARPRGDGGVATTLDDRQMVFARRRHALADSRRFADGLAPAAGFDSVGFGKRFSVAAAARPVAAEASGVAKRISLSPALHRTRRSADAAR